MRKCDTTEVTASSMTNLMDAIQQAGFQSMSGFGIDWLETIAGMGSEVLNFTAARIIQDLQTQHDLLHAKGLAEVQQTQAQFFQKAIDDYTGEIAKLMGMGKALALDTEVATGMSTDGSQTSPTRQSANAIEPGSQP